jgi:hypothetical protein
VPLLVLLGRLKRVVLRAEIGAGVLPVRIEEKLVEASRQVVVMGDVLAGARCRIDLLKPPDQRLQAIDEVHP